MKTTINSIAFLLFVSLMIFARSINAQSVIYVQGNVSDLNGNAIASQNVYLSDDTSSLNLAIAVTDASGNYLVTLTTLINQGIVFVGTEDCNTNLILNTHSFTPNTTTLTSNFSICAPNTSIPCALTGSSVYISPNGLITNVNGGTSPYTYLWTNGSISTWQPFYSGWCVTIVDANGCDTTICDTSNIISTCQADFTAVNIGFNPNAVPVVIQFSDMSVGSANSWLWDFGDGTTGTGQNPIHSYLVPGTYYVCITIEEISPNGIIICSDTFCDTVVVGQSPTPCSLYGAYVYSSPNGLMAGGMTVPPNALVYLWSNNQTTSWSQFYPNWCVTITDMNGCDTMICDTSSVTPCTLSGASVVNTPNGLISTVNGGTPPYTYLWSNGSANPNPPFYPNWCLQIIDANGCDTIICDTSSVTPCTLPGAYVYSSPNGLTAGTITMPPNALVYVWNNGVIGNWSPFYQNWCVQIIDSVSGCDTIICDTSSVWIPCNLNGVSVMVDSTTNMMEATWNPNYSYLWDNGDTTQGTQYYSPWCVNVYDNVTGCDTFFCDQSINICFADFYSTQVSSSDSTFFTNLSLGTTNMTSYFWDFGDNTSSTDENPVHLYATSGWYYVCLSIMDSTSNCYSTYCDYMYVSVASSGGCQSYFISSLVWNTSVPANTFNFYDYSAGNITNWLWDFGDGNTSTQQNPTHSYSSSGSNFYYICLTISEFDPVTQALICTDTYCDSIYLSNPINCYALFNGQDVGNNEVFITNLSSPQSGTTWVGYAEVDIDYGDGNMDYNIGSTVNHTYSASGTYNVCVTTSTTDSSGTVLCTDTFCDSVTVTSGTMPCQADFYVVQDSTVITTQNPNGTITTSLGDAFFLYNLSTPVGMIQSWQWDMGDGGNGQYQMQTSSTTPDPIYVYDTNGVYNVCLTITTIGGQCTSTTCDSISFLSMQGQTSIYSFGISELKLFPNPTNSLLNVSFTNSGLDYVEINIINMVGQKVLTNSSTVFNGDTNISLDVSLLSDGVYSVEVVLSGSERLYKRVVISR